jgi:hypothetical protein
MAQKRKRAASSDRTRAFAEQLADRGQFHAFGPATAVPAAAPTNTTVHGAATPEATVVDHLDFSTP